MPKFGMEDARSQAIEELLSHLGMRDSRDLGDAMKPKGDGLEITKIEKLGGDGESDGDESPGIQAGGEGQEGGEGGDDKSKMSDEEVDELIQALQSKLGG